MLNFYQPSQTYFKRKQLSLFCEIVNNLGSKLQNHTIFRRCYSKFSKYHPSCRFSSLSYAEMIRLTSGCLTTSSFVRRQTPIPGTFSSNLTA